MTFSIFSRRKFLKLTAASFSFITSPHIAFAEQRNFPAGFKWGVASASGQVESRVGRGRSNWDAFADVKGHIQDGSTNAVTTEFEKRYTEDLKIMADADVNAFRFSFAWPRIQPNGPGEPSATGLDTYDRMIDEMLRHNMTPLATMFHWDSPVWAGDLRDRDMAKRMADYADIITRRYGDRVPYWLALNEPNSVAVCGYAMGIHAPGLSSREAVGAAIHHQNLATGLMIDVARTNLPKEAKVSTTINLQPARPASPTPENIHSAKLADVFWNTAWLDPLFDRGYPELARPIVEPFVKESDMATIASKLDFIGMNYYCRIYTVAEPNSPLGFILDVNHPPRHLVLTDFYPVEPDGLTEILLRIHHEYDHHEIMLTETGFALADPKPENGVVNDPKRIKYLREYLLAAHEAVQKGVKLGGIFYWAGTDNWEWAEGFSKTFGLVQVDHETQKRTPKASLDYYSKCIRMNGVADA